MLPLNFNSLALPAPLTVVSVPGNIAYDSSLFDNRIEAPLWQITAMSTRPSCFGFVRTYHNSFFLESVLSHVSSRVLRANTHRTGNCLHPISNVYRLPSPEHTALARSTKGQRLCAPPNCPRTGRPLMPRRGMGDLGELASVKRKTNEKNLQISNPELLRRPPRHLPLVPAMVRNRPRLPPVP